MKYLSCRYINALCFNDTRIVHCTVGNSSKNKQYAVLQENYNGEPIDWKWLVDSIDAEKESFRNGKVIESCEGCLELRNIDWDFVNQQRKFDYILFSNWYNCNSACIYCYDNQDDFVIEDIDKNSEIKSNDTYDIIPIVKDLIEKDLLSPNVAIEFAGGEPTIYYKFDEALKILVDAGVKNIIINTNAIRYSKEIENAISKGVADVVVSVDAGTKEVHRKIKRVASYDKVIENLTNYCKAKKPENKNRVWSKFIIVDGVNDKEEEIQKWIMKAKEMNITKLYFNADDRLYRQQTTKEVFGRVKELVDYFIDFAQKEEMHYMLCSNVLYPYTLLGFEPPKNEW
jgi:wyosine [tRNA(Phe)-imidazoG37] synthetase (radical SAM superfamily)